jgi:hypothetical protein
LLLHPTQKLGDFPLDRVHRSAAGASGPSGFGLAGCPLCGLLLRFQELTDKLSYGRQKHKNQKN